MNDANDTRWTQPDFCKRYGSPHDLGPRDFGNAYYTVKKAVTVWVYTGETRQSNCWYGSSNVLSQKLQRVDLKRGDQIHATCGGTLWAVPAGTETARRICAEEYLALGPNVRSILRHERAEVTYKY